MSKKNLKVNNSETQNSDDTELVTNGYLRSYMAEFKVGFRDEINSDFQRYIGALMEDNQHKFEQLIESFNMRTEAFERYIDGNEADKQKINSRPNRLESKVLLA